MWAPLNAVPLLLSVFFLGSVDCTYSIYMDKKEVSRLMGITAELSYVRNGTINHNALNHVFTLPADFVDYLIWESYDVPIAFTREIKTSNDEVLRSVSMNISSSGIKPVGREIIATEIICSGQQDAEVEVEFSFNLTADSDDRNFTQISYKRKKLCHRDSQKFTSDTDERPVLTSMEGYDSSQLKVFYVVLCFGCSLFTSLIVCFLAYFVSNKKDSRRDPLQDEQQIRLRTTISQNDPYVSSTLGVQSGTSTSSNMSHTSNRKNMNYTQLDNRLLDLHDKITEISIQRRRIRLQKIELEGTFGRLFNGTYTKEDGSEEYVLVKTVMDFACPTQVQLLLKEGLSMYGLKHRNIMSVMGVSMEEHAEPFVIYLREGYSNLKKFLQKCKLSSEGIAHTLTTQEVVEMALQIIAGIQYMHKKKILHKDLASRNCLIDGTLNVKIGDSALSRDLFPNDYHCLGDNENRPVKWLAIESLIYKTFSTASDVWSFGVTLWELTTLAQQPYVEVDPFEVEYYLKDGYRLSQPVNCPDELFAVMAYCWAMSPDERPTFSQLLTCLQDFRNQLNKFV